MSAPIRFYYVNKPYGFFSNFSNHPLDLKGKRWPTSEHYYQAQKFAGTPHEEEIRLAPSPKVAADKGRERNRPLRTDWEAVKDDVMREALLAKFTQHPDLKSRLLATGDAKLTEHTARDRYWGDGGDGFGLNRLGELLMELRDKLQRENSA